MYSGVALINGEVGVAAGDDFAPVDLVGIGEVEEDHFRPWRHDAGDGELIELEHAGNHVALAFIEDAGGETLLDEDVDLFVGNGRLGGWFTHAEGFQNRLGKPCEQVDDGRDDAGERAEETDEA